MKHLYLLIWINNKIILHFPTNASIWAKQVSADGVLYIEHERRVKSMRKRADIHSGFGKFVHLQGCRTKP